MTNSSGDRDVMRFSGFRVGGCGFLKNGQSIFPDPPEFLESNSMEIMTDHKGDR